MTTFSIEVKDDGVNAGLNALAERVANMQPVLQAVGEDIVARTKARFSTATDPAGNRWQPNARATIEAYIAAKGGFGKRGINKKGQGLAISKRPLQGESGDLARQFHISVAGGTLTVSASPIYAAIQQFGGQAGRGKKVTIPARPFLPVTDVGELYPADRERIVETINRFIVGRL